MAKKKTHMGRNDVKVVFNFRGTKNKDRSNKTYYTKVHLVS